MEAFIVGGAMGIIAFTVGWALMTWTIRSRK